MMRILSAAAGLAAIASLGCAVSHDRDGLSTGGGGGTTAAMGGRGGGGGAGGAGGSIEAAATTGSGTQVTPVEDLCGDGVKDPTEQCDGEDFGGVTCEALGLKGGDLKCNSYCAIVASSCGLPERCDNAQDDDEDGLADCLDPDCSAKPACIDSCAEPIVAAVPSVHQGDTTSRPAVQGSSCSSAEGPEVVYQVTAPASGDLSVTVWSTSGADFTISIRSACADPAAELLCQDKIGFGDTKEEQALLPVIAGATYYVIVDGTAASDSGSFQIALEVAPAPGKKGGPH